MATNFTLNFVGFPTNPIQNADTYRTMLEAVEQAVSQAKSGELGVSGNGASIVGFYDAQATGSVTFAGAATVADTVTLNGQALTATQQNSRGTCTFASLIAGDSVSIGGVTFTAAAAASGLTTFALGADDTAAASNCVNLVNAYPGLKGIVTATSALGVVTFRAAQAGVAGDAITLTSSDGTTAAVSPGATLGSGAAIANNQWDQGDNAQQAAESLAGCINRSSTAAIILVGASVAAGSHIVNLTTKLPGSQGNYTLAKVGTNIAVSAAALAGGLASNRASATVTFSGEATAADTVTIAGTALTATQKNATGTATFSTIVAGNTVTIAGITFTAATLAANALEFTLGISDTTAATALAAAVNAYPLATQSVTATSNAAVVTFRAVLPGTAGNSITLTRVGAPITVTGSGFLTNGAAAANNAFDPGNSATTAAVAFAAAVNASTTAAISGNVTATQALGVVTLTARVPGQGGNVTLTKSGSNIAVSGGGTLTGGQLGGTVTMSF